MGRFFGGKEPPCIYSNPSIHYLIVDPFYLDAFNNQLFTS